MLLSGVAVAEAALVVAVVRPDAVVLVLVVRFKGLSAVCAASDFVAAPVDDFVSLVDVAVLLLFSPFPRELVFLPLTEFDDTGFFADSAFELGAVAVSSVLVLEGVVVGCD